MMIGGKNLARVDMPKQLSNNDAPVETPDAPTAPPDTAPPKPAVPDPETVPDPGEQPCTDDPDSPCRFVLPSRDKAGNQAESTREFLRQLSL